jgi:3-hydroxy-9,10-secoandrosta-1,3,5(10)-triene-9,17-dione monooxygenase reductase component
VSFEKGEFRAVLGHFASGVALVTGMHNENPTGLTCQSFFSLSLEPPLVALAPGKSSTSWPRASSTGNICINILADNQEALALVFATTGADKFDGVGWSPGGNGAPRLQGALAWIEATITDDHDAGDHHLVVARVVAVEMGSGRPLLFYRGGFGTFES